jgi:hypothetical protein
MTPISDDRREAIITLLKTRDDNLPQPTRHTSTTPGFVNEKRPRDCPDCCANGRTMHGCETCGGSGTVAPARLDLISVADELPDDGDQRDPYSKNERVLPYGFDSSRHDHVHERDAEIERLRHQTRPARPEAQLLNEANRRGYAWEETRRAMYRRYDYPALDYYLEQLRDSDDGAYHALHSIHVYAWLTELSPATEVALERGIVFLDEHLPEPLRAPGQPEHPAAHRQRQRSAA